MAYLSFLGIYGCLNNIQDTSPNLPSPKFALSSGLDAVYQLATMVQARLGPEVNLRLAEKLFLEAANQGHAPSQAALGQFYKFTNRDYEKSLYWYGKAAVNGENDAQYNMAFAHFNGNGTQKSPLLAYQWLTIAMENQGELGRYYTDKTRKRFGKDLTAAQKADAESKALAWLKKLGFLNPLPISTSKIIPRFPTAKVTELEWKQYLAEIRQLPGGRLRFYGTTTASDTTSERAIYFIAGRQEYAYPAIIKLQVVRRDNENFLDLQGHYAGSIIGYWFFRFRVNNIRREIEAHYGWD